MRFAYIDSQGNEVPIPSVDALALRIELGAIGPETELFDAQENRWGPAHTHEIFHTLSREQDEGFVAPPPLAPPPVGEPEPSEPPGDDAAAPDPPAPSDTGSGDLGFELTLTEAEEGAEAPPSEPSEEPAPAAGDDDALDFTLATPSEPALPEPEPPAAEEAAEEDAAFDFGGLDSLEMEEPAFPDEAEPAAPAQTGAEEPLDFGVGGSLDTDEPDFSGLGAEDDDLALETPMSEFSPDAPPAWMEQDGPSPPPADEPADALDFSMPADEPEEERDGAPPPPRRTPGERPQPRNRPSAPRRPKKSPTGPLVAVAIVGALAAGGWYAWRTFQATSAAPPSDPGFGREVTLPPIPTELLPTMRDLGERALAETAAELRASAEEFDLAAEPREAWLAGAYLANASDFADVQEYWEGVQAYVESVRERDGEVFHERYAAELEAAGIQEDTAQILLERADSGFLATQGPRYEAYAQMDDLANAALDLHRFLLDNEDRITYSPAAGGVSADPVLEAVPDTPELGDRMWEMVDRITGALDRLGTLDRVTTERLLAVLFDRFRVAGFR